MSKSSEKTPFEVAWGFVLGYLEDVNAMAARAIVAAQEGDSETARAAIEEALAMMGRLPALWTDNRSELWAALDGPTSALSAAYIECGRAELAHFDNPQEFGPPIIAALFETQTAKAEALTVAARDLSAWLGGDPARIAPITIGLGG
jgi:hypothetical protein